MRKLFIGSLVWAGLCASLWVSWAASLGRQRADTTTPSPRAGHVLVYDEQRKKVLLLDGYQPPYQPDQGEIWEWGGNHWSLIASNGPACRSLSGTAYDQRRKRLVLFGGVGKTGYKDLKGDTWEWDARNWQQMTDTTVGTRDHHTMAYDAARGKVVMYGGQTATRTWATDTWEWDGNRWQRFDVPGPGARAHHAMVYDSKRRKVILFGGLNQQGITNDTWEWEGTAWRKLAATGPEPRARHRMAFDSRRGVVVLYGGNGSKTTPGPGFRLLEDTWLWDGRQWTEVKGATLGKRFVHAMAYDRARDRVVLYGGGSENQQSLGDTWEWDGRRWAQVQ